jgi:hypothetical protein
MHFATPHEHHRRRLVEKVLREYANDPASVEVQTVMYGPRGPDGDRVTTQLVFVGFREKDQSGAKVYPEMLVRIEADRPITHGPMERLFLPMVDTMYWSPDPNGPKLSSRGR